MENSKGSILKKIDLSFIGNICLGKYTFSLRTL